MLKNLILLLVLALVLSNIVVGQNQDSKNLLNQIATENSNVEWLRLKENQ